MGAIVKWYSSERWITYRDCYQLPCGEYTDDDSWTATFGLRGSYAVDCQVFLIVRVAGARGRDERLRARHFSVSVAIGTPPHSRLLTETVASRRPCQSVKEAKRLARAMDCSEALGRLLRTFYSPRRGGCIFRDDGEQWRPWLTEIGPRLGSTSMPPGRYFTTHWMPDPRGWRLAGGLVEAKGCTTVVSMGPELRETRDRLGSWLAQPT